MVAYSVPYFSMQSALPLPPQRGLAPVRPVTPSLKPPIAPQQAPADPSASETISKRASDSSRGVQSAAAVQQPLRPVRPSWNGAASWSPTRQLLSEPQLQIQDVLTASNGLAGSQQLSSQVSLGSAVVCGWQHVYVLLRHARHCRVGSYASLPSAVRQFLPAIYLSSCIAVFKAAVCVLLSCRYLVLTVGAWTHHAGQTMLGTICYKF
jgi:hypothetical protein